MLGGLRRFPRSVLCSFLFFLLSLSILAALNCKIGQISLVKETEKEKKKETMKVKKGLRFRRRGERIGKRRMV